MRIDHQKGVLYNLARLFRTLRYLRPSQFFYRARKVLLGRFSRLIAAQVYRRCAEIRIFPHPIVNELRQEHIQDNYKGEMVFSFLNKERKVDTSWQAAEESYLWQFNLHYFDFLFSKSGSEDGLTLILDWIKAVPDGDKLAWHPYTTSRRISNWIWFLSSKFPAKELEKQQQVLTSIHCQLEFLKYFIERDLLGNHLIANAQALITAGFFLRDEDSVKLGCHLLEEQLPEQVLPDGGHYERSPMYHVIVLEDLIASLIALRSTGHFAPKVLELAINDMSVFLLNILEDNSFPLLNDSAYGIAIDPQILLNFIAENGLAEDFEFIGEKEEQGGSLSLLESSGLVLARREDLSFSFDIGEIGPDYLPGHAHNDTLSLLVNLDGEQILTDSGVYEYQGPLRNYFRSARAHNVVMLEGVEPNEIWSSFRVGRRGYPSNVFVDSIAGTARASHTGYQHLGVNIRRCIQVLNDGLIWIDIVDSSEQEFSFESNLHFAPGCELGELNQLLNYSTQEILKDEEIKVVLAASSGVNFRSLSSPYSEYFGEKVERLNLRSTFKVKGRLLLKYGIFRSEVPEDLCELWEKLET